MSPDRNGPSPSSPAEILAEAPAPSWSPERQNQVESILENFFAEGQRRASAFAPAYVTLWQKLEKSAGGGKRFRPRMVATAYSGLGGSDPELAAQVGAAFELLHTAFVIHDDVIDRDFVRRGIPNVAGSYREQAHTAGIPLPAAEHRGMSVGVVAGDLVLSGAFSLIARSPVPDSLKQRLFDLMDDAVFASAAGELMDVDFALGTASVGVSDIIDMERLKTAVYSFETPLQAGAVLAGADSATVALVGALGGNLGIAYQIVDDILGVFGDPTVTGKSTLGDLREGKRTVLIAFAESTDRWPAISVPFGNPELGPAEAEFIKDELVACGALSFAEGLVQNYAARARTQLQSELVPAALREELTPVIDAVVGRQV